MKRLISVFVVVLCLISVVACSKTDAAVDSGAMFGDSINFVCCQSPGGDTDTNGRLLTKYLEKELGVNIVFNNLPGSNGAIALTQYKDEAPTADTFLITSSTPLAGNYATGLMDFSYTAYDPVAIFGISSGLMILVPGDSPYNTLEELIEATKERPNEIIYGAPTGGASYLASYLAMNKEYGAKFGFMEAGDGNDRLLALLGGHIDVCDTALPNAKDYMASGELKALATLASIPNAAYPDILPASKDYPKMVEDIYYVLLAIKGTDPDVIDKMNEAVRNVTNNPEYQKECYDMNLQNALSMSVEDTIQTLEDQKNLFVGLAALMEE